MCQIDTRDEWHSVKWHRNMIDDQTDLKSAFKGISVK